MNTETIVLICGLIIGAYLLGSIPSAVWIGKWFYGVDVREHGSRNAGATNTLRVLGRKAALPVFVIDAGKGFAAVMLCKITGLSGDAMFFLKMGLATAAVVGHIFPIFAGFKGGKGVATMTGCMMAIVPIPVLMGLLTFIIVLVMTEYVSVSSMTAGALLPVYIFIIYGIDDWYRILLGVVLAVVLVITHRKNIKRLREGTESKTYLYLRRKPDSQDDASYFEEEDDGN